MSNRNENTSQPDRSHEGLNPALRTVAFAAAGVLLGLTLVTAIVRLVILLTPSAAGAGALDSQAILEQAQDSVNTAQIILSFLETVSVLATLAVGAAAIYGFRSSREAEEELQKKLDKIEDSLEKAEKSRERTEVIRDRMQEQLAVLEGYQADLSNLRGLRDEIEASQRALGATIGDVALLLQADQEFRLKNYITAYGFARRVLEHNPQNPLALYIAGWLEVHHFWDKLDEGIAHLKQIADLRYDWPTARAAYAVGIRRKAKRASGDERNSLFLEALGVLAGVLRENDSLMDFNNESFWAPVGGIWRDLNNVDEAIRAYEHALRVTPGSSYPLGNLAALYLQKARQSGDGSLRERALQIFARTDAAARAELANRPNDYFLLMDIAMASLMQGHHDARFFKEAHARLNDALALDNSLTSLETSLRGWEHLYANCPDEWPEVKAELERTLDSLRSAMQQQSAEDGAAGEE